MPADIAPRPARTLREFNQAPPGSPYDAEALEREFFATGIREVDFFLRLPHEFYGEREVSKLILYSTTKSWEAEPLAEVVTALIVRVPFAAVRSVPQDRPSMVRHLFAPILQLMCSFRDTGPGLARRIDEIAEVVLWHCEAPESHTYRFGDLLWVASTAHRAAMESYTVINPQFPYRIYKALDASLTCLHSFGPLLDLHRKYLEFLGIERQSSRVEQENQDTDSLVDNLKNQIAEIAGESLATVVLHGAEGTLYSQVKSASPQQKSDYVLRLIKLFQFQVNWGNWRGDARNPRKLVLDLCPNLKSIDHATRALTVAKLQFSDEQAAALVRSATRLSAPGDQQLLAIRQALKACGDGGFPKSYEALRSLEHHWLEESGLGFAREATAIFPRLARMEKDRFLSTNLSRKTAKLSPTAAYRLWIQSAEYIAMFNRQRAKLFRAGIHLAVIYALSEQERDLFTHIVIESYFLSQKSAPDAQWLAMGLELWVGQPEFAPLLEKLMDDPSDPFPAIYYKEEFRTGLQALAYLSVGLPAVQVGPILARYAAVFCFVPDPQSSGIQDEKLGNACIWGLANRKDGGGVPYLVRLHARVNYPKVKKKIDAILDGLASTSGVTRSELEETALPDHGLDANSSRTFPVGEGTARIVVTPSRAVEVTWQKPGGKFAASIPQVLRGEKPAIAAVRTAAKEIEADLALLKTRLQHLWLDSRSWDEAWWQEVFAGHPLRAPFAASLIWNIERGGKCVAAIWQDGAFQDIRGQTVNAASAAISLWHPISCPVIEVHAWRRRLRDLGITQPFKQAHREVYTVTDAERQTGTYSNRFAGHILRQHQFMALARMNNWRVTHRMWVDRENDEPAHLILPGHGLVCEYWTEGAGGDDPEVTDANAYVYLTTDRLCFYRLPPGALPHKSTARGPGRGEAVRIEDVPPLVLSEVMRQCDLFTGVCSVANDPAWLDRGADAQHPNQWRQEHGRTYWNAEAFGPLSATAETRRDVIAEILPALAISSKCRLEDRFLHVEGQLRSYKIHLGSSNILMSPGDRYLCIVPARKAAFPEPDVRLPFEGDAMLSIILSKALLLAEDNKITDPTILRQIT